MNGSAEREVVLVTGFPRLIARRVTDALLEASDERVVKLLARGKFIDDARAFVGRSAHASRIEIVDGDAASIDLGLSGVEFRRLADEVDYIQHCAHVSYEGADARVAEALNVQGAREVLELARAARKLKRLVHQSTTRVSGDHVGTFDEADLDVRQSFRSSIEETMFRAERIMRRAMDSLPVTVLRPSIIVGDSRTGEIDRLDGPYLLMLLVLTSPAEITLPLPARGDALLHVVPLDYVTAASVALMTDPAAISRTIHLVDPTPLPARRAYELFARAAGRKVPRGFIPVNFTRALLRTPGLERFVKSPRAFLEQLATPVTYTSVAATELLAPKGIECAALATYVDTLVQHVRDRLAARKAERTDDPADVEDPLA